MYTNQHLRINVISERSTMTISERIFKLLKDKNISQSAFAKKAGLANSTISDWKTKKTNPSTDKIMDICLALDVTPEQLLTGKGIEDPCTDTFSANCYDNLLFTSEDIRILKDIHGLKIAQRERLLKYIDALKQIDELEDL